MKIKYAFCSLLWFSLLTACAYPDSFSFVGKEAQWRFYGEGLGSYVMNMGRDKDQTSMWLSTDWGETQTAYFTWNNLSPGSYKVITYVRAQDVRSGLDGASFWSFYDGGYGEKTVFKDLAGDYNWRKIEYNLQVKASDLTVWFRLKTPGQVWVDDFYIEKTEGGGEQVSIERPVALSSVIPKKIAAKQVQKNDRKKLYSFEGSEAGHPFSIKNKAGEFAPQKFYNFKVSSMPVKDWSKYDHLEMDVFNPNEEYTNFFVTLADDRSTDYWSRTNYKQMLAPGWNKINLSLTQFLGERGSHRYQRPINLTKIDKFYINIDPDSKETFISKSFLIDNIFLTSNPMPVIPEGVKVFDFTSHRAENSGNITSVTTQTSYNVERGFGFVEPKFWRVEDSQYAGQTMRYTIGILDGHFRVNLPNGKYQINLVIDKLGYWDVPFWADRSISANGSFIFKETRGSGKDFLNDLLRFEGIVPDLEDHPYDLYLSKVFFNIDKTVVVTNGVLDLEFNGDETGVSLNSLIIWNKNNEVDGLSYKKAFEKRNRDEFDWMSHSILKKENISPSAKLSISVVEPDLYLNPGSLKKSTKSSLKFQGGIGDNPYQVIQLNPGNTDEKISWSFGDFTNDKGQIIHSKSIALSDLIFQYTAPDLNHETYLITGKYLKPLEDSSFALKKNKTKYLWLQLKIDDKTPKGIFKGEMVFHKGSEVTKFPLEITVLSYTLPGIEFPVGFFGLDPLPYSYFPGDGYNDLRKKFRYLSLNALGEAGFTTFTSLPNDESELDELFKASAKWGIQTVYSYGGQFPQGRFDISNRPSDMTEEAFYSKAALELKPLLTKKGWPKIVHTFSDEAGGYSDRIVSDIELGKKLKKYFPFMSLGGFGSFHGGDSNKLNALFDYGFFSSLTKGDISKLRDNNQRWGFYNASAGNLDDPRFSFGLGLYLARLNGLSQYLEWHATAVNNYPYFDFDGRESDVVMFFPTRDGKLLHALRFELATEGLHVYKKMKLLENAITNNLGSPKDLQAAKAWMDAVRKENYFYSSPSFMSNKKIDFRSFEMQLEEHLKNIFLK